MTDHSVHDLLGEWTHVISLDLLCWLPVKQCLPLSCWLLHSQPKWPFMYSCVVCGCPPPLHMPTKALKSSVNLWNDFGFDTDSAENMCDRYNGDYIVVSLWSKSAPWPSFCLSNFRLCLLCIRIMEDNTSCYSFTKCDEYIGMNAFRTYREFYVTYAGNLIFII